MARSVLWLQPSKMSLSILDREAAVHRRGPGPLRGLPDAGQPRQGVRPQPRVRLRPLRAQPRARIHAGAKELQVLSRRAPKKIIDLSDNYQKPKRFVSEWIQNLVLFH